MTRRVATVVIAVLALVHAAVVLAPVLVLAVTAEKGGVPGLHGFGLLAISGLIGVLYAALVWRRLARRLRDGMPVGNAMIANFDGLVVLALAASILLFVVLGGYAPLAWVLAGEGWSLVALWAVIQLVAVLLAELTRRGVDRWLEEARLEGDLDQRADELTPR